MALQNQNASLLDNFSSLATTSCIPEMPNKDGSMFSMLWPQRGKTSGNILLKGMLNASRSHLGEAYPPAPP